MRLSDESGCLWTGFWLVMLVVISGAIGIRSFGDGYERGQIDAANGEQHYHLTRQKDGATIWVDDREAKP